MKKIVKVVALLSMAAAVMMGCKNPAGGNTDDPTGGNTTGGNTTGGSTTDSDTPAPGGDKDGGLTLGGEDDTETDATGTVWTKQLVSGGWHVTGSGKLPALITSSGAQYEECYIVKDGDYSAYTSFKVTFEEFGDNASELQFKVIEDGGEEYIPIGKDLEQIITPAKTVTSISIQAKSATVASLIFAKVEGYDGSKYTDVTKLEENWGIKTKCFSFNVTKLEQYGALTIGSGAKAGEKLKIDCTAVPAGVQFKLIADDDSESEEYPGITAGITEITYDFAKNYKEIYLQYSLADAWEGSWDISSVKIGK